MSTYAALTDGTTTVTFASPANGGLWYKIESGWGPRVAGLRQSQFGGRGPYEDVQEEIPVSVGGSNAAHMYANVSALKGLLDNANRWYRNEAASATLFKYSPEGATISSAASPLQVATWGAELELPSGWPNIPASGGAVWSSGLTMRFTRKGEWLHNTQSASASGTNGSPVALTFASAAGYFSPISLEATNTYTTASIPVYLCVSTGISGYYGLQQFLPTTLLVGDARWGWSTAGSVLNSTGASTLRFNPSAASSGSAYSLTSGTQVYKDRSYSMFVSAKNNSPTISYSVKIGILNTVFVGVFGSDFIIPAGASNPNIYAGGVVSLRDNSANPNIAFGCTPSSSAASTNYLELDAFYIVDNSVASVFKFINPLTSGVASTAGINHYYLSAPNIGAEIVSGWSVGYSGQSPSVSGASAQALLIATDGTYFRQATGSAASLARSNTWTLTRTNAYLTPV